MRLSPAQRQDIADRKVITDAGFDLTEAVDFFRRNGIGLARHPANGWQFTGSVGKIGVCAFWHEIVGDVSNLLERLDAPSLVLKARKDAESRAMARF